MFGAKQNSVVLDETTNLRYGRLPDLLSEDPKPFVKQEVLGVRLRVFLPAAVCFFITNVTNGTILPILEKHHLMYSSNQVLGPSVDKTVAFLIGPAKSALYFVGSGFLLVPIGLRIKSTLNKFLTGRDYFQTLGAILVALLLIATVFPLSFGRSYGRISIDPFNQDVSQLYRRLLVPALSYLYHLNGFLFVFVAWFFVFLSALMLKAYLKKKLIFPSLLEEVSFLTVGIFASCYQFPGYPEVLVLLFAFVALFEYEEFGRFTEIALMSFALALMAHESAAVLIFAPMLLVLFGPRSWLNASIMLGLYVFFLLANFGFHPEIPLHVQATISNVPATFYFYHYPFRVFLGCILAFKALWILVVVGLWRMRKVNLRLMWFCTITFGVVFASTYIAVDYTRMIGLATVAVVVCLQSARNYMSRQMYIGILAVNILLPGFYMGGNTGLMTFKGIYYQAYKHVLPLPLPQQTNHNPH